jgi:ubiquitin-protein ligase
MTPRERRLLADVADLRGLESENVEVASSGPAPERYTVTVHGPGLEPGKDDPRLRDQHQFDVYLPLGYPRRPPVVVWQSPIFHPNILPPTEQGCVCIKDWQPSRSLLEVCLQLVGMATFGVFDLEQPLNRKAADWVRAAGLAPGEDLASALSRTPATAKGEQSGGS